MAMASLPIVCALIEMSYADLPASMGQPLTNFERLHRHGSCARDEAFVASFRGRPSLPLRLYCDDQRPAGHEDQDQGSDGPEEGAGVVGTRRKIGGEVQEP